MLLLLLLLIELLSLLFAVSKDRFLVLQEARSLILPILVVVDPFVGSISYLRLVRPCRVGLEQVYGFHISYPGLELLNLEFLNFKFVFISYV